jgi:hypothetical protein
VRRLLTTFALGAILAMPTVRAQAPAAPAPAAGPGQSTAPAAAPAPARGTPSPDFADELMALPPAAPPAPTESWQPAFLQSLPQPKDQPSSLFQEPAPITAPPPDLERPYFRPDPMLEPPQWGQVPGWFSDTRVDVIHPQIFFGGMRHSVTFPSGQSVRVSPGSAKQNWTAAPRIEIGYRLPSGFGGFSFSDRFFNTSGTGPFVGPGVSAIRTTHMGVNYSDWDYTSREYTAWTNWTMEWRAGVRLAETWITTQAIQPFDRVAPGGVFEQTSSNYTVGAGPHFALVIDRKFPASGLSAVMKLDFANTFTRERQLFTASLATLTASGAPERAIFMQNFWQQVPILNYQVGLGYQPPQYPNIKFFLGYVYEFWWQIASNTNIGSDNGGTRGFFGNQGIVFQGGINW